MQLIRWIDDALTTLTGVIAAIALLVMMLGTSLDATARFLFNRPIAGMFEVAEATLVVLVFLGLGWAQQDRKHIRATMLVERLGGRARAAFEVLAWGLSALFLLALALPATEEARASFEMREFRWGSVQMPIWWVKVLLALGLWLGVLQMLRSCVGALRGCITGSGPGPGPGTAGQGGGIDHA